MKYLYVANWKMNLSFNQSINFCTKNNNALEQLATAAQIILCPSFVALTPIADIFKKTAVGIGAQSCSEHASGAYTGEISALSLEEIGVQYCIIGHSERRMYYGETTENILQKIYLLYAAHITPILCIGESHTDFLDKKTFDVLTQQLKPILTAITEQKYKDNHIIIAYEPVWAIGAGIIPKQQQLTSIFEWLSEFAYTYLPDHTIQLLYGGSVNANNITELKKIPPINGFLIGGASTDFEQFKTIITL
ncbi:MAG TPA: triose-phosphate isomerase family protein [Candidatus Babeliales bacterium]|jgi:triosephosphate isomerase|nr:triose-phosphate isomerase family protein [Candidatus Babeliales bacterium]